MHCIHLDLNVEKGITFQTNQCLESLVSLVPFVNGEPLMFINIDLNPKPPQYLSAVRLVKAHFSKC